MKEENSYQELRKEAKRLGINTYKKTKEEITELVKSHTEQLQQQQPQQQILPRPQKDFNLMTWEEGISYIRWAGEEVGYKLINIRKYLGESEFSNFHGVRFDEMWTWVSQQIYMEKLFKRKVTLNE